VISYRTILTQVLLNQATTMASLERLAPPELQERLAQQSVSTANMVEEMLKDGYDTEVKEDVSQ
jgi:hypothetical protein